jgi:hypothetical protein
MAKKQRGTPAWYRDRCDDLWKAQVKERAGNFCEKCGKPGPGLHAHHYIPKGSTKLAFEIRNGVCLCYRHHIHWAHIDVEGFRDWFMAHRPEDHAYITQEGHRGSLKRSLAEWEDLYNRLAQSAESSEAA